MNEAAEAAAALAQKDAELESYADELATMQVAVAEAQQHASAAATQVLTPLQSCTRIHLQIKFRYAHCE